MQIAPREDTLNACWLSKRSKSCTSMSRSTPQKEQTLRSKSVMLLALFCCAVMHSGLRVFTSLLIALYGSLWICGLCHGHLMLFTYIWTGYDWLSVLGLCNVDIPATILRDLVKCFIFTHSEKNTALNMYAYCITLHITIKPCLLVTAY